MTHSLAHLNYVAILVVALAGFLLGWLWYSPLLFAKPWMKEMKINQENLKSMSGAKGARMMATGFTYTLVSTFALAVILRSHSNLDAGNGALFGLFIGALISGARKLNSDLWGGCSLRLQAINVGHEIVLFTMQGAILGAWR